MGKQVTDRDARLAELRQVGLDWGFQVQPTPLQQEQDRGQGGHHLGEGGHIKQRVLGHGLAVGFQAALALGPVPYLRAMLQPVHGPGDVLLRHGAIQRRPHLSQPLDIESLGAEKGRREQ